MDNADADRNNFFQRFSAISQVNALWTRAAEVNNNFNSTRDAFWRLVNHDDSSDADAGRSMLESANFKLRDDSLSPVLDIEFKKFDTKELQELFGRASGKEEKGSREGH